MAHVAMTGANGFLGWHTRAALQEANIHSVPVAVGAHFNAHHAVAALEGAARAVHLAGVNRGAADEIRDGNIIFAEQLALALKTTDNPPPIVVYANSTQAGNGTPYGTAKAQAADILEATATRIGASFVNLPLPNLFGEHGRPFYNSVTATFSHLLANDGHPVVVEDKELALLHAQNAADVITGAVEVEQMAALQHSTSVSTLLDQLRGYVHLYNQGEIPNLASAFDRDLFNTYRSFTFPAQSPIKIDQHEDTRGSFFETIRSHGGAGQSSFSTTQPGITRGDHFHRRKIERFTVLQGEARISLRRLYTARVFSFNVSGDKPCAVDMPTMWTHNITNIGEDVLFTSFWTNDLFDPHSPDTIAEEV